MPEVVRLNWLKSSYIATILLNTPRHSRGVIVINYSQTIKLFAYEKAKTASYINI